MRPLHGPLGLILLATLANGCAVLDPADPRQQPARCPLADSGAGPESAAGGAARRPLTLEEALRLALEGNPDLAASAHDLSAARARHDEVAGEAWPSVHVVGGYSRFLDSQRLVAAREEGEAGLFSRSIFSGDVVLTMPVFTGGRITSRIAGAELLRSAAEHTLARTREELFFEVTTVFYGILAHREVVRSLEFSGKALREHLTRVKDLIAARKAARVDQLRTEVRIADLEQMTVREQNVLAVQTRVLANLLGLPPLGEAVDPVGRLAVPLAIAADADTAHRRALSGRSDYLAARAELEARAKAVDAARAGHWPTVSVQGSFGGRWATGNSGRTGSGDASEDVGRVGVIVDLPVFEGGRIEARVREEQAALQAARERLRRLELQLHLDVETALLNISSAIRRVEATGKAVEQATESLRIEREKYDLGKGAIVDVLDAQSALLESQTNYYRALADGNVARAQLELAMGDP